jgi:hypothetical protein
MYQLVSAIAKPLTGDSRWKNLDIGNIPFNQLFSQYKKVIAVLSNVFLPNNVSLNIEAMRATYGASSITFNGFLQVNGNATLPTTAVVPAINSRYAHYADAVHADYEITPTHPSADATSEMPRSDKTWLRLTKPGMKYSVFHESCLVNVNGFYHKTDAATDAIYVVDGNKTANIANRNEVGILSFRQLGKISLISITEDMVYTQKDTQSLRSNCYVDTGQDVSDKTVMLVLGGYLHVLDPRTFHRISSSTFSIDFSNLPLLDRYFESKGIIDLSSLPLEIDSTNDDHISINNLYSDEVLLAYLTLSQSFFVVLDNPDIFIDKEFIQPSKMPGVYTAYGEPRFPIVVCAGRHETYWYHPEKPFFSIHMNNTLRGEPNYDSRKVKTLVSVSSHESTVYGEINSPAFYLKIGTDL